MRKETTYKAYKAHGNILTMPHLPAMNWDYKDQMINVELDASGNKAYYVYDASGNRVRKVVEKGNIIEERFYVGDYEVYRKATNGTLDLERDTIHISDDQKRIAMIDNDGTTETIRYQIDNHLGSASLELDENAATISYEEYHLFGTTSYRSGRTETEVSLKRYKYVGKERDEETGLYYYGARYYAAWIARFVSVDPLQHEYPIYTPYQYAGNKPISFIDLDGLEPAPTDEEKRRSYQSFGDRIESAVKDFFGMDIEKPHGNTKEEYNKSVEKYRSKKEAASQNLKNTAETINKINDIGVDLLSLPLDAAGDLGSAIYFASKGDWENSGYSAAALFIPFVSGTALKAGKATLKNFVRVLDDSQGVKNVDNFFSSQGVNNFKEFFKKMKGLTDNEKILKYEQAAERVAKGNNWEFNEKLSKRFNRKIYNDSKGTLFSLDTRHGEFEVLNKKGQHQGAINFEGTKIKGKDKSKKHDLKL